MMSMMAAIMGWTMRIVVMRVMIIVVIIPNVDSISAVFVAPLNLSLEMRPFSVLISLNRMVWVSSSVPELPSMWIWNACVPIIVCIERKEVSFSC